MSMDVPSSSDSPRMSPAEKQAQRTEREAAKKIAESQRRVREAQNESNRAIENIRDEFVRQSTHEEIRQQTLLDQQRERSEETLRNLQQNTQVQTQKTRHEGERKLNQTQYFYQDQIEATEKEAKKKLDSIQRNSHAMSEYERMRSNAETELLKQSNQQRTEVLRTELDDRFAKTQKELSDHHEKRVMTATDADQKREENFQKKFSAKLKNQQEEVQKMESRAARALNAIRQDTAQKISAYEERQQDPFYQMMSIGAKLTEDSDAYFLTAKIPSHEQQGVSVSLQGNRVVIKGSRKNEEETELPSGAKMGSSSFQSYHESYELAVPVESSKMTKVFDGDELIVVLPKKGRPNAPIHRSPYEATAVREKARFPENLPKPTPQKTSAPGEGPVTPG